MCGQWGQCVMEMIQDSDLSNINHHLTLCAGISCFQPRTGFENIFSQVPFNGPALIFMQKKKTTKATKQHFCASDKGNLACDAIESLVLFTEQATAEDGRWEMRESKPCAVCA